MIPLLTSLTSIFEIRVNFLPSTFLIIRYTVRRGVSTLPFLEHPTLYWFSTPFLKYHAGTPFLMNHPLFNENPPNPPLFKPKFFIDQKLHETYT